MEKQHACTLRICPKCSYPLTGVVLICPRCREVIEQGCSGNCSNCGKKEE